MMNTKKILLLLTAALPALAAQASAAVSVLNNPGVNAFDRYAQDQANPAPGRDGTGDFLSGSLNNNLEFPGKLTAGNRRQLWDFDLPELGAGESVTAATLTFRLGFITSPGSDFSIYGSTIGSGTTGTASLYQDPNYNQVIGTFAHDDDNTTVSIDVLAFVNANYAADGGVTWASFRIQSDDVSGANHNAQLGGLANTTQGTQLTITTATVPEPSTLGVLGLGGLVMLSRRRRGTLVSA